MSKIKYKIPGRYRKKVNLKILDFAEGDTEATISSRKVASLIQDLWHSTSYISYLTVEHFGEDFFKCAVKKLPVATGLMQLNATVSVEEGISVKAKVLTSALGLGYPLFGWENPDDWRSREAYFEPTDPEWVEVYFKLAYRNWKRKPLRKMGFSVVLSRSAYDEPEFATYAEKKGIKNYDVVHRQADLIIESLEKGLEEHKAHYHNIIKNLNIATKKWLDRYFSKKRRK